MKTRVLITGAGGYLGSAIARALVAKGHDVYHFSRRSYPVLEAMGVRGICGDLAHLDDVRHACQGMNAIIHTAALTGMWGKYDHFYQTNVVGTANVIQAARDNRISKLVYTSTPSVVFNSQDIMGGDESLPYPSSFLSYYAETKALAERLILAAHDGRSLSTVAIRPHLIWGPNEPHMIPRLVAMAQQRKLHVVGDGTNQVDVTHIDNAVEAHLLALDRLVPGAPIGGKAYFIGQDRPVLLWQFINRILQCYGVKPISRRVPLFVAYAGGSLLEHLFAFRRIFDREPAMTRFVALQLGRSHYFSHEAAQRDLGYAPVVSVEEGLERLVQKH